MKSTCKTVSVQEARLLFGLTCAGLALRFINLINSIMFPPPRDGVSFGIYSIFDMEEMMSPIYSFIVFAVCIPLATKIAFFRTFFSLISLGLLTGFFDYWLIQTQQAISYAAINNPQYEFKTFDFALLNGSIYDVLTLVLVNVLFVWHITILIRELKGERSLR